MIGTVAMIGVIVHASDAETRTACNPAVVMGGCEVPGQFLLRVFRQSNAIIGSVGGNDVEGWFRPSDDPIIITNPDGTARKLDTWHIPYGMYCPDHS